MKWVYYWESVASIGIDPACHLPLPLMGHEESPPTPQPRAPRLHAPPPLPHPGLAAAFQVTQPGLRPPPPPVLPRPRPPLLRSQVLLHRSHRGSDPPYSGVSLSPDPPIQGRPYSSWPSPVPTITIGLANRPSWAQSAVTRGRIPAEREERGPFLSFPVLMPEPQPARCQPREPSCPL